MIPAGTMSPQPAEILESGRFEHFLDAVKQVYDVVIVDSAPLLPVADTLELLPGADCVVLCVRSGQTTKDQARAVHGVLEHYPSKPTGLAITGLKRRDAPEYGYYGYEAFGGGREIEAPSGELRQQEQREARGSSYSPEPRGSRAGSRACGGTSPGLSPRGHSATSAGSASGSASIGTASSAKATASSRPLRGK